MAPSSLELRPQSPVYDTRASCITFCSMLPNWSIFQAKLFDLWVQVFSAPNKILVVRLRWLKNGAQPNLGPKPFSTT